MRVLLAVCLVVNGVLSNEVVQQTKDSMISKVIQMLGEEKDKITANIAAETTTMAEYTQWCDDTMTEHSYTIKSATQKIIELNAVITDSTAQIHSLDQDIAELGNQIAETHSEIDEANANRAKENDVFLKAEAEQATFIEELEQLEAQLKEQMAAIAATPPPIGEDGEPIAGEEAAEPAAEAAPAEPAAEAFLQLLHGERPSGDRFEKLQRAMTMAVNSIWVDPESKKNLALLKQTGQFIQEEPPAGGAGATTHLAEANKEKEEQIAAFEGLRGKAEEALQRMRDNEAKKQAEHDMNVQVLKQAIALAENNLDDAKREHARISQEKAEATNELGETEAAKAADETALRDVTAECTAAAAAWDKRQSEATAERAAIDKAKEILSARVNVFIQVVKGHQTPTGHAINQKTRVKLVEHFRALGGKLHSLAMLNLVSVVSSDPMEQVKGLLNNLIEKLVKEAKETADLHEFCKAEKEKTSAAIKKKTATIDGLDARLETAGSKKQQLSETVSDLSAEIAEIDKSQAEATKLRNEEHATFQKVAGDYTEAASAVDDAMDALKEYYGSAALVQTNTAIKSIKAPPQLGGAKSDSAGGILSILETMGEEFRKSLKSTNAQEREDQHAFDTMVHANDVSKAAKKSEITASQSEIKSLSVAIHNFGGDRKMTAKELASVNEYVAKLKPQCGGRTVSYAERKAKRDAEIQGLQDALAILEADAPAGSFNFLQIRSHLL